MRRCLILSPFPVVLPRDGGQKRLDSIARGLRRAGWSVTTVGIYPAALFNPEQGSPDDILLSERIAAAARDDVLFFDLRLAQHAAAQPDVVTLLRRVIARVAPDIIHLEQPWDWLLLRQALPSSNRPKLVYSNQDSGWRQRLELLRLSLKQSGAESLVEVARLLELEVTGAADLIVAGSDLEANAIENNALRSVLYAPPTSALADCAPVSPELESRFSRAAAEAEVSAYAAMIGSSCWPDVEGFFDMFPHGLGFLPLHQQIWVGGTLGPSLQSDPRFQDFLSINASRSRMLGNLAEEEKAAFLGAATCVVVPVRGGAGARPETADAIASGRPVVITPQGLEGYGSIVQEAMGRGVYVAHTSSEFRALLRQALRGDAVGCSPEICKLVSLDHFSEKLNHAYEGLLAADQCGSPVLRLC